MYRKAVNKRRSAKSFRRASSKTHAKNMIARGGFRL